MPFRFPLQAVLHLRQSLERQQELLLRSANQQVWQMQYGIEQVEARRRELRDTQARRLGEGMTAAELHFALDCEAQLSRYRRELDQQLARLEQLRDQQREIYRQARRMRETIEGVRERQLRDYEQQALRREQRDLDDLFLLRREYLQRG